MSLCFRMLVPACLLNIMCSAQTKTGDLFTRHPSPYFRLSQDGKTLGVLAKGDNDTEWMSFLDLTTFTWKPKGTISTKSATITPDLTGAFGNMYSENGFKGDQYWLPYKKFTSWYYPNNTETSIKQFPDQHIILAQRSDGTLLTGGSVSYKKGKKGFEGHLVLNDLNITDPATGQVVQNIRKGEIMRAPFDLWRGQTLKLVNDDSLLWQGWSALNLYTGTQIQYNSQRPLQSISGRYGLGGKILTSPPVSKPGDHHCWRVLTDLTTGAVLYSDTISIKEGMGYFIAAGGKNRFYTLNGGTGVLEQLQWNGQKLEVISSQPLTWKETFPNDFWKGIENYSYWMHVSESTGQVLLTPNRYEEGYASIKNRLMIFSMKNGALAFDNPSFIQPHGSYLAQQRADAQKFNNMLAAATVTLAPNVWVRNKNSGLTYRVLGKNASNSQLWDVVQYEFQKTGNWSTYKTVKLEIDLTYQCTMISPAACGQCNGGGTVNTVSQRTTEKTDKMIYTQITTTKTENVHSTVNCGKCKGAGVLF